MGFSGVTNEEWGPVPGKGGAKAGGKIVTNCVTKVSIIKFAE